MKIETIQQYIEQNKPQEVWVYKLADTTDGDDYTTISKHVPELVKVVERIPRHWDYSHNTYISETDPLKFEYEFSFKGQSTDYSLFGTGWNNWKKNGIVAYTTRREAWNEYNKGLKAKQEEIEQKNKLAKLRKQKEKLEKERCTVTYQQIAEKFGIPIDKLIITGQRW